MTAPARRGHMSTGRKILLSIMTLGTVGTTIGAGTFASFTASTTNSNNTFSTATLILGDQAKGGTTGAVTNASMCFSANQGAGGVTASNTGACAQVFSFTLRKPGTSNASYVDIDLKNAGGITGTLTGYRGSCGDGPSTDQAFFHGTSSVCDNARMYIQEYSDSLRTTPSTCWYGTVSGSSCTTTSTTTITGFNSSASPLAMSTMSAGATRYFRITLYLATGADNQLQGVKATFDLNWVLTQS